MPSSTDPVGQPPLTRPGGPSPGRSSPPPTSGSARLRCPACASPVHAGDEVCPVCGEDLREKPRTIRCRRCGRTASSQLSICPHCGRELAAAAPRWLTWGAPAGVALLLVGLLALQSESGNPLRWIGDRAAAAREWVASYSASLDPQVEVIPIARPGDAVASAQQPGGLDPIAEDGETLPSFTGVLTGTNELAANQPATATLSESGGSSEQEPILAPTTEPAPVAAEATATATPTPNPTPTAAVTLELALPTTTAAPPTPIASATIVPPTAIAAPPTATAAPTSTTAPTSTPAPTNTPGIQTYTVQEGDTSLSIARRFGVTLEQLIITNDLTPEEAALIRPGQQLRIPAPSASGEGVPSGTIYTVRAGDTLLGISLRLGVPVAAILVANNLTEADATRIRPDDRLIIPAPTPTPGPTATATPIPTATPIAMPTATPPPATATPAGPLGLRLPAPRLRGPQNGVTIRCASDGRLSWEAVTGITANDLYRVHLGFVSDRDPAGNLRVTWIIDQNVPSTTTQAALDKGLCDMSSDAQGNQWRWYVEIVEMKDNAPVPVSPPSDVWGFVWN